MALPAIALAALKYGPAAFALGKSLFGGRGGGGDERAAGDQARQRFDRQARKEGERGDRLTGQFDQEVSGFNPMDYMNEAAGGMFSQFKRDLGQNVADLRGEQVGAGRIKTGYGTEDEDRLFTEMGSRLNDRISGLAMQGAGMNLNRIGMMGSAGERSRDRSMDADFGRYATERESRDRRAAGRRGMVGNIGGALLNAGATYFANRN